eukprot:symbB.v1.2.025806.t1/scaffold2530.1/size76790/2
MTATGFSMNTLTYNAFANSIQCGDWRLAHLMLLPATVQKDVVSYTLMMDGTAEASAWRLASHFLQKMYELAISPDLAVFHIAAKSLQDAKCWPRSSALLSQQRCSQLRSGVSFALALGSFESNWTSALVLFQSLIWLHLQPEQGCFTALLDCMDDWQRSLQLFRQMIVSSVRPSAQSVKFISNCKEWRQASVFLEVFSHSRLSVPMLGTWQKAMSQAVPVPSVLISLRWTLALELLVEAVSMETMTHNAVITACEKSARWTWALQLLERLADNGRPSTASFNAAASATSGRWLSVLQLFQDLSQRDLKATAFSFATALSSCEKCHAWQSALLISQDAIATVAVFNAAISSCERGRQWRKALVLLSEMDTLSIEQDVISINSAISSCEKCSRWGESIALFDEMCLKAIFPDIFSVNSVILSCRRAQRWREAVDLFNNLNHLALQADALSWDFVLSACEECSQWPQANALLLHLSHSDLQFLRPFAKEHHAGDQMRSWCTSYMFVMLLIHDLCKTIQSSGSSFHRGPDPRRGEVDRISKAMAPADKAAKEVTPFYQGLVPMSKRHLTRMPTISSVSTADSGGNLPVKNTFIDLDIGRPPSLEGFFNERLIRSAPGSQVEDQTEEPPKEADAPPVICLAAALSFTGSKKPTYSMGSEGHGSRECHPCAFYWKDKGCSSGADCNFCHLCNQGEKKRRQKEKRTVWRSIDRVRQAFAAANHQVDA